MNKREVLKGLYGITSPALTGSKNVLESTRKALEGGMKILQYRDKTLPYNEQLKQAVEIRALCHRYHALLIINDDVRLAQAVQADGIHLGHSDAAIEEARKILGNQIIIGCSCYNRLELAVEAEHKGADYVAFGRFFPSVTKPQALQAHPEILSEARSQLDIPLCAIGGVTTDNAPALIALGADMVAVINDLFAAQDIRHKAQQFVQLFH